MPYCPNPDCPFRRRFSESAEYRAETAACSDCGSTLTETDVLGPVEKIKPSNKLSELSDIYKRILWTLALVAFWRILNQLPLPGLDFGALKPLVEAENSPFAHFSLKLLSLGLLAYINAYVLIEVLSLFLNPLKRWRVEGGAEGRVKLVRTSRWTAFALAIYHASSLVFTVSNMAGGNVLNDNSLGFRSLLIVTLVAGLFITVWIADMISAKGIGHGISILFLAADIGDLPHRIVQWLSASQGEHIIRQVVILLLISVALVVLIMVMERSARNIPFHRSDGRDVLVPIKITTAGTTPLEWAGFFFGIPMLILGALAAEKQSQHPVLQWLAGNSLTQSPWRTVLYMIVVIVFYYLFTAFFHNPRKMSEYVNRRQGKGDLSSSALLAIDRSLEGLALIGSLYIIILAYARDALWAWFGIPLFLDGLAMLLAVCISLDISNEIKLRWRASSLVKIADFHEPWKAGLWKGELDAQGIPSVVRGYHHRALLYFFGPYIEMSIFVPREHAEAARNMIGESAPLSLSS